MYHGEREGTSLLRPPSVSQLFTYGKAVWIFLQHSHTKSIVPQVMVKTINNGTENVPNLMI
jgi:hypothetical protein